MSYYSNFTLGLYKIAKQIKRQRLRIPIKNHSRETNENHIILYLSINTNPKPIKKCIIVLQSLFRYITFLSNSTSHHEIKARSPINIEPYFLTIMQSGLTFYSINVSTELQLQIPRPKIRR